MLIPRPGENQGFSHVSQVYPDLANQEIQQTKPAGPGGRAEQLSRETGEEQGLLPSSNFPSPDSCNGENIEI